MSEKIDKLLREELTGQEYRIPESFDKKVNDTIRKIENSSTGNRSKPIFRWADHKAAAVMILVLGLSVVSVTSYGAVNLFQKRMQAMPEKVIEKYNQDVQNSNAEADLYSRKLTKEEEEKIVTLRKQYEENGVFPENEISQVEDAEEIRDEVCFVTKESKFYLPERTLSEEELLQIIDLQEKRDYSLQQKNSAGEEEQQTLNEECSETSIDIVSRLYELDKKELKYISADKEDDVYEYLIQGKDTSYYVYYSDENVADRVMCARKELPAHQTGIKMKKTEIRSLSESIKKQVEVFTDKKIDTENIYCQVDDNGKLVQGTVSYYYQMRDGSGCVAVYSAAYKDIYDIYILEDEKEMKKNIERKVEKAKKNGYQYRAVK